MRLDLTHDFFVYMNFSSGWLSFPPHDRSGYLKFAVHGRGCTRSHDNNNGRESVMQQRYSLLNDYSGGAHPMLLNALRDCNDSQEDAYGNDF